MSNSSEILFKLIEEYRNNTLVQNNGTKLLGYDSEGIVKARHILFKPLSEHEIELLKKSYILIFPSALIELYSITNGANMFLYPRHISNHIIPMSYLSIYGVPRINKQDANNLEPFNISVEDLRKSKGCPKNWLRFGFSDWVEHASRIEYYFDVSLPKDNIQSCYRDSNVVLQKWHTLDEFLAAIFDDIKGSKYSRCWP
jgi:hypothetical protein